MFSTLGLKPHSQEKKKKKKNEEKKDKKKKDSSVQKDAAAQKVKSKPFEEKKKEKNRLERSLSPIFEERRVSKMRLLKIAEKTSSSSNVEDETYAITIESMNVVAPTTKLVTRLSRPSKPI